jgi:hypothetical protein
MIKHNKFKEVVENGADNYISSLKDADLYDEVAERIIRRFNPDPIDFIKQQFENKSNWWEPIFSDLNYSHDSFYEGFEFNVKAIIDFSFPDQEIDYHIITNFHERVTRKIIYSITLYSDGKQDTDDPEFISSLISSSDMEWIIVFNQENENNEFRWVDFGEDNLVNFLNNINDNFKRSNSHLKWFPIASSYYSSFIFTTEKRYNSIIELNLMPPEGFKIDDENIFGYPKGIIASKKYQKEILPNLNIICEVQMEKEGLPIFVKLWRKSKEGMLNINIVPQMILEKVELLAKVGNQLNLSYGNIVIDTNKVLSDKEFADISDIFSQELIEALSKKSIDLKNNIISIFRNDSNTFIRSCEIKTDDNKP